jgi:toxin FitB
VTRFLLDTNIISDMIKPQAQPAVLRWIAGQAIDRLHFSAVALGEIKRGIAELPAGRKRESLETWYSGPEGPRGLFGTRILSFDERAAEQWAEFIAEGRRTGRPRSPIDMMIAATAAVNACTLVTLNGRDFEGIVDLINPLED